MDNPEYDMENAIIHNADNSAKSFIREWLDQTTSCITANTSGSTGTPKAIRLSKADMIQSALATCEYFNLTEASQLVMPLSANYIAGKMMIVRAMVSGAILWIETATNEPLSNEYNFDIDLVPIVPSQIDGLLKSPNLSRIKNLIVGGAPISIMKEKELRNSGINAYASYGMTETCSHVALRSILQGECVYHALPGITFDMDNRNCLIIAAPDFSYKRLITNDIVKLLDDQTFEWIGRYDNIINSGGIKVYPENIEQILSKKFPEMTFYITSRSDDKWGNVVVMVVEGEIDNQSELLNIAKSVLPKYHVPKEIIVKSNLPRTASGKLIRERF